MPIRALLGGKSFDPETIKTMNAAFLGVCADLGLTDKADPACEIVAMRVIQLADGERNAAALRAAVLASIKAKPIS